MRVRQSCLIERNLPDISFDSNALEFCDKISCVYLLRIRKHLRLWPNPFSFFFPQGRGSILAHVNELHHVGTTRTNIIKTKKKEENTDILDVKIDPVIWISFQCIITSQSEMILNNNNNGLNI